MPERAADRRWMQEALALARRGLGRTRPNPPVGSVIVRGGSIVGHGYHRGAGKDHAEVNALRQAGARAGGATLYVTLEPCSTQGRTPPCTRGIVAAGVRRVVCAVRDPNPAHRGRGIRILRRAGIKVEEGVGADEASALLRPFGKWITSGLPYCTLKLAMSLDGRIADARGRSRWISSPESRRVVERLRLEADAVLVGRETACSDDPSLLCRTGKHTGLFRVVTDSRGALSPTARMLSDGRADQTIIAVTDACSCARRESYRSRGAQVWVLPSKAGRVSMRSLFRRLGRMGLLHVLCEGGGQVAESLLRAELVDESVFFMAAKLIGAGGRPAVGGPGWPLGSAPRFAITEIAASGPDVLVRARPLGAS